MSKSKPRKTSRKTLKSKIEAGVTRADSADKIHQWRAAVDEFHFGAEAAGWLRDFNESIGPLVELLVDGYQKEHGGDQTAKKTLSRMLRDIARDGFNFAAKRAYDKQLAATATAVTKSQRKAAERRRLIVETFKAMTDGTKTDRVRRTANDLELSTSLVWAAVRDLD